MATRNKTVSKLQFIFNINLNPFFLDYRINPCISPRHVDKLPDNSTTRSPESTDSTTQKKPSTTNTTTLSEGT